MCTDSEYDMAKFIIRVPGFFWILTKLLLPHLSIYIAAYGL